MGIFDWLHGQKQIQHGEVKAHSNTNDIAGTCKCPRCGKQVPRDKMLTVDVVGMRTGRTPTEQGQKLCIICHSEVLRKEIFGF